MKKIISALILALLLSSCVTRRACERRFPNAWLESRDGGISEDLGDGSGGGPGTSTNTTNSSHTVTLIRDTTMFIRIPGDTLNATGLLTDVSQLSTSLATSSVYVKDGIINHRLEQRDTAIGATIKGALKTSTTTIQKAQTTLQTRYINQLTGWQKVQVYLGRIFLGMLAVIFLWKVVWFQPKSWRNP